jgi:TRAP-type C4-dicarboxylate transport system permease large subunit
MTDSASPGSYFLVEWYQTGPVELVAQAVADHLCCAATAGDHTPPTTVLITLTMPADQTVFAVFSAPSCESVLQVCRRAGWPADRISADVVPWLAS